MREWLLKDEEKNKVGRPRLAKEEALKKAKISIALSLVLCLVLSFYFVSTLMGTSPLKLAYHLTLEKAFGAIENKDGFIVNYKYDNDSNYIMEINVPKSVDKYSGSYKYWLYEMKGNSWKEKETGEFEKGTNDFKIKIKSLKNKNKTYKIKLQIINASKIDKSYAPAGWNFNEALENSNMYAYKVFTVKGYYSPVTLEEIKEAKKNENKITISTTREDPRTFILNLPTDNTYNVNITYTDASSKTNELVNEENVSGIKNYSIPSLNRSTLVTFKIYGDNVSKLKLSNWEEDKDKNGNYITNTYVLKPENTY